MEKRNTFSILSKKLIYIAFPFLLLTCKKEELSERTYPRMDISEDIIQTETGIQFKGIILTEGNSEVIESGFIWSTSEDLDQEFSKIKAGTQNSPGSFTATASCDFVAGQTYYVRSFVETKDKIVYSKAISFINQYTTPAPAIDSISPAQGHWGEIIKIHGKNLSYISSNITVGFNESTTATVTDCNDSVISIEIPAMVIYDPAEISVSIYGNKAVATNKFAYIQSKIEDFNPKTASILDTLSLTGSDFTTNKNNCIVSLNGVSLFINQLSENSVKAVINNYFSTSKIQVKVTMDGKTTILADTLHIKPPVINSFSPTQITAPNQMLTIYGEDFNPENDKNKVFLGDQEIDIVMCTSKRINIRVPDGMTSNKKVAITVQSLDQQIVAADSLYINY